MSNEIKTDIDPSKEKLENSETSGIADSTPSPNTIGHKIANTLIHGAKATKTGYDKVSPVAANEWQLFKGGVANVTKEHLKPAFGGVWQDIGRPLIKTSFDITFKELGYMSSAISGGYNNYVQPGLKATYGDTIKPLLNAATIPLDKIAPETSAKLKDKLENGVTDPARTARTGLAYGAAALTLSWRAILWTADALLDVFWRMPLKGYNKFRNWEPENTALNTVKSGIDVPLSGVDFVVGGIADGLYKGYKGWNKAFEKVPYPLSVGVFTVGGAVIGYTTLEATKYIFDAGASQLSESKAELSPIAAAYQFAAPKLSKVALYKPMITTYKTSRDGFFESDLYRNNLRPAYLELIDPIVQEAKDVIHDFDDRVEAIAPVYTRAKDSFYTAATNKEENQKARAEAVDNLKWSAKRVFAPAALLTTPVAAAQFMDYIPNLTVPFALVATATMYVVQSARWKKQQNENPEGGSDLEQNFSKQATLETPEAGNDNVDISNDNPKEAAPEEKPVVAAQGPV